MKTWQGDCLAVRLGLASARRKARGQRASLQGAVKRSGYTLLELMLVLAILVVISAIAYPSAEAMFSHLRLSQGSDAVRGAWASAGSRHRMKDVPTDLPSSPTKAITASLRTVRISGDRTAKDRAALEISPALPISSARPYPKACGSAPRTPRLERHQVFRVKAAFPKIASAQTRGPAGPSSSRTGRRARMWRSFSAPPERWGW